MPAVVPAVAPAAAPAVAPSTATPPLTLRTRNLREALFSAEPRHEATRVVVLGVERRERVQITHEQEAARGGSCSSPSTRAPPQTVRRIAWREMRHADPNPAYPTRSAPGWKAVEGAPSGGASGDEAVAVRGASITIGKREAIAMR